MKIILVPLTALLSLAAGFAVADRTGEPILGFAVTFGLFALAILLHLLPREAEIERQISRRDRRP